MSIKSSATHTGSVFIEFANASGVPYLSNIACCHSSVNNILTSQTFVSNGFVFHLTCADSVFKKLQGILEKNLITLGSTGLPNNVSGASVIYSPKLAVWSATNAVNASASFSNHSVGAYLLSLMSSRLCNHAPKASA
ncbi:MAG: hypothetical protein J6T10_19780 [Methanobrevibacter sp.]|nr:hypothetical protein [Methanobrevibacter sp.]